MNVESSVIPLLASPQGGVAERLKRFRGASADREAGVVFRLRTKKENHPVCAEQGSFATSYLTAQPPLLAVMQGGEYSSACNSFTPSLAGAYISSPKLDVSGSTPTEVVILQGQRTNPLPRDGKNSVAHRRSN